LNPEALPLLLLSLYIYIYKSQPNINKPTHKTTAHKRRNKHISIIIIIIIIITHQLQPNHTITIFSSLSLSTLIMENIENIGEEYKHYWETTMFLQTQELDRY